MREAHRYTVGIMSTVTNLDLWREARVMPVDPQGGRHSIHCYFNTCPESPCGQWVLTFLSEEPEGEFGDVACISRDTGDIRVLAKGVTCEDAHRQAYQQWSGGGRYVVYQDLRDNCWQVRRVNMNTGEDKLLATGWQIAFGRPDQTVIPMHGPHWGPGDHRDIMLLDVACGEVSLGVSHTDLRKELPEFFDRHFPDGVPVSLFFPNISPEGDRVFFKVATPNTGVFKTPDASFRRGFIVYDMKARRTIYVADGWGHPAWSPDNHHIITPLRNQLHEIDSDAGTVTHLDRLPDVPGSHPNYCPSDPRLVTTDAFLRGDGIPKGWWGVWVGLPETGEHVALHQLRELPFGVRSWRPAHPHPVFSADGHRLYFNVSAGQWTRLHVAEI